jgi:hypothetical protein
MRPALVALAVLTACGAPGRFALRAPVWEEGDDRPFWPAPAYDEEMDVANTVDVILLHPLSHGLLFEPRTEALDVNSLDEVPSSTWFTNRAPSPEEAARGACVDEGPELPFTIVSSKSGGTTPGLVVQDVGGQRYLLKFDDGAVPENEAGTAADAVVSRLYWSVGFHVPCNRVLYVARDDLVLTERSEERHTSGSRRPLTVVRLERMLRRATRTESGLIRLSASRYLDGTPIGTWRGEGTRRDDPNDRVAHQDRRSLRGERFLAAWVAHWDSRGPNTFDAFVTTGPEAGHVVHHFLDFSDALAGISRRTRWPEPRVGHQTVGDLGTTLADAVTFGVVRRPWDAVARDPRYPNLAYFDVEHFSPMGFAPQTPLERWARADGSDLGWMARRIARISRAHLEAIVATGRYSDPAEEARMVEVLLGRRDRILETCFAVSSPLADVRVEGERLCAVDLARPSERGWEPALVEAWRDAAGARTALAVTHGPASVCVALGAHFAPGAAAPDAAARYAIVEISRVRAEHRTVLRAHLYDLGPDGWFLAGLERPS